MGLPRQWSRSLMSGTMSGLEGECTRVVHEITELCTRVRSGTRVRVVHEMVAQEYVVVHEYKVVQEYGVVNENEWCTSRSGARDWCTSTSGERDGCTRVCSGARVVREITEWCTRVRSGARVVHEIGARKVHEIT